MITPQVQFGPIKSENKWQASSPWVV